MCTLLRGHHDGSRSHTRSLRTRCTLVLLIYRDGKVITLKIVAGKNTYSIQDLVVKVADALPPSENQRFVRVSLTLILLMVSTLSGHSTATKKIGSNHWTKASKILRSITGAFLRLQGFFFPGYFSPPPLHLFHQDI